MARRLTTSMRRVDRILKNGLTTGNFNNLSQVQSRSFEYRLLLSQTRVYFSSERPKKFDKPLRPKEGKNVGPAKTKAKETKEKKKAHKKTNHASTTSTPKSAPTAYDQGINYGDNNGGGEDRSCEPFLVVKYVAKTFCRLCYVLVLYWIVDVNVTVWWPDLKKSHEEITWKDFADNYLDQGRVASIEVVSNHWLRVQTTPGASGDVAKTVLVKIDSLDSYRNVVPVPEIKDMKVDRKNEAPVVANKTEEAERDLPVKDQKSFGSFFYCSTRRFLKKTRIVLEIINF